MLMLRLSKKADYALIAMKHLALSKASGVRRPVRVRSPSSTTSRSS